MMKDSIELLKSDDPPDRSRMGGIGASLVSLTRAGFNVPDFVIIPADSVEHQPNGALEPQIKETSQDPLRMALTSLASDGSSRWAVRSSAVDEDGAQHAFAGQLASYLNIAIEDVADRVEAVRRSGHGDRASAYRAEHGLSNDSIAPAVVVQRMLTPDSAGVAFSADPISGRRGVSVVSAVAGLGEKLVS
ncbi:MAG: PEP/pyruvate-binding domain-containing protein, partial [Pseudomonadota bacterium]